jgi:hypothetical protein
MSRHLRTRTSAGPLIPGPLDLEIGDQAPFRTAAQVFALRRSGRIDPASYGVTSGSPFSGEQFVVGEVFYEVAHRYGDEVLLWDGWGALPGPDRPVEGDGRASTVPDRTVISGEPWSLSSTRQNAG